MGAAARANVKRRSMQRVLVFDGDKAVKRFAMLRVSLLSGGDGKGERSREILRKEARLLDALDTVSAPVTGERRRRVDDQGDPEARELKQFVDGELRVTIAQNDFDLLSSYVDKTPWVPRAARSAVDLQDWLSAAEKLDEK